MRWNHLASYRGLPSELEDIRLLLEQRSEAEFQWTPYEDPTIRAVIPEEFLQNPNAWHAKVVLINYATVEPHQTDRVLRQFGCRQPIPADPEVFDDHHKINLRLLGTNIIPELACVPEYMPWFKIHGKPYLLAPEERQRQIRVGRERREPLNPRRQDFKGSPSTRPRHSPGSSSAAMQSLSPMRAPTQSPDATIQQMIPMQSPFPMMPGVFPSPYMYPNPYMYPFPNPMAGWSQMPGSAPFPVIPSGPPISRPVVQEGYQGGLSGSSPF
ncbi:uncharacterized protein LOC105782737 [Gossypium raimondii]|uniref:uncharacterized protein LOC105782737 n=1 Tax=Gossypium raimondii TaxID=29730 RepID=UPI00227CAE49|nr:uncharacterized protein LOC105782737 [Gossypium raimondii]